MKYVAVVNETYKFHWCQRMNHSAYQPASQECLTKPTTKFPIHTMHYNHNFLLLFPGLRISSAEFGSSATHSHTSTQKHAHRNSMGKTTLQTDRPHKFSEH